MTAETQSGGLKDDVAQYLQLDEPGDRRNKFMEMVETYRVSPYDGSRVEFLSEGILLRIPESVDMPELTEEGLSSTSAPADYLDEIAEYIGESDIPSRIGMLSGLEDSYDGEWVDKSTLRLYPFGGQGLEISVPSLSEIADFYNASEDEIDRELVKKFAEEHGESYGDTRVTAIIMDDEVYYLEGEEERMEEAESVRDALSLPNLVQFYRDVRDMETPDSGKEVFDETKEVFHTDLENDFEVISDFESDIFVLHDLDTQDLYLVGEEHLEDEQVAKTVESVREQYEGGEPESVRDILEHFFSSLQDGEE